MNFLNIGTFFDNLNHYIYLTWKWNCESTNWIKQVCFSLVSNSFTTSKTYYYLNGIIFKRKKFRLLKYNGNIYNKNMRVSSGVIFEMCGVLIKFLLKKWTFVAKKWRFIQICTKWRSSQEWRSICADTVYKVYIPIKVHIWQIPPLPFSM